MKKRRTLAPEVAEQMLMNVFEACRAEPNTVPLQVLTSYASYRKERYSIQRTVIVLVLILFVLLPALFFPPNIAVTEGGTAGMPVYEVRVSALLPIPVAEIRAVIDGANMTVTEMENNVYAIHPNANGEMVVSAQLYNRQRTETVISVTDADFTRPELTTRGFDSENVYLFVEDDASGIDWNAVTAVTTDEKIPVPLAWNTENGCIKLAYPETDITVTVPDLAGNVLEIALKAS